MPYVEASSLELFCEEGRWTVTSPFWTVIHDLERGGTPIDIRFAHGQPGNVLRAPLSCRVDGLTDAAARGTTATQARTTDGLKLRFTGSLTPERGAPSGVRFTTTYLYTPYEIRRQVELDFPRGFRARRLRPLDLAVDDRFTHWTAALDPHTRAGRWENVVGPHYTGPFERIPAGPCEKFRDSWPHGWATLFRSGGEGIQVTPVGDLRQWDAPCGATGQGRSRLLRQRGGTSVVWDVLAVGSPLPLPRTLGFTLSLGLTNVPATALVPPRMAMLGNPPFPGDAVIRAWAASGVDLIVLMEGTRWMGTLNQPGPDGSRQLPDTDRFWRMGSYEGYPEARDRRDLARVVRSARRAGIKIVPYMGLQEIHPEIPQFGPNIRRWRQQGTPNGGTMFHWTGNYPGAVYGGFICPDAAGVQDHYVGFVRHCVEKLGFDGIYIDLASKVYCHNTLHGPAHHGGMDGLWRILGTLRKFLGKDRPIVAHNGDCNMLIPLSNYADSVVTLEGINGPKVLKWDMKLIGQYIQAMPSCPALLIPNYEWYHRAPHCREAMEDGLAKSVLLGSVPFHLDVYWNARRWGYRDDLEYIRDDSSVFGLFRRLRTLPLAGMAFQDAFSGAVRTARPAVRGARYSGRGREVIVLANLSRRTQRQVRWKSGQAGGVVGTLGPSEYRFIERRLPRAAAPRSS